MAGIVGAVVLIVAVAGVVTMRVQASRIADRADAQHGRGDCADSLKTLDRLERRHRIVARDIAGSAEEGGRACELLLEASQGKGQFDPKGLAQYVNDPGARWGGAGIVRAKALLGLSDAGSDGAESASADGAESQATRDPKGAVKQLAATLDAFPDESGSVRKVMETYVGRFGKTGYDRAVVDEYGFADETAPAQVCADRDEYTWLHKEDWSQPELAEPIAKTDGLTDEWLLACANAKATAEKTWGEARTMYDTYLEEYADQPGAKQAKQGRADVVASIKHKQARAAAVARAGRPADGSNLGACGDGRCQVRVSEGDMITIRGRGGPYQLLITTIGGGTVDVSLGGTISSMSSTGGSSIWGGGYASWAGAAKDEMVLNEKVGFGVDGINGSRATLSVWLAP